MRREKALEARAGERSAAFENHIHEGPVKSCKDLRVFRLSYALATEVFEMTSAFPKEELYSLTDQIRRSSRSVTASIVEGWAKRRYENFFKRQPNDSIGSCEETKLRLKFSFYCRYMSRPKFEEMSAKYDDVGRMLFGLVENWRTFQ